MYERAQSHTTKESKEGKIQATGFQPHLHVVRESTIGGRKSRRSWDSREADHEFLSDNVVDRLMIRGYIMPQGKCIFAVLTTIP